MLMDKMLVTPKVGREKLNEMEKAIRNLILEDGQTKRSISLGDRLYYLAFQKQTQAPCYFFRYKDSEWDAKTEKFKLKDKHVHIGTVREISLVDAYAKAQRMNAQLGQGIDPSHKKKEDNRNGLNQPSISFQDAIAAWHKEMTKREQWSLKHQKNVFGAFKLHILDAHTNSGTGNSMPMEDIGNQRLKDITFDDLKMRVDALYDSKKIETANRLVEKLVSLYDFYKGLQGINLGNALQDHYGKTLRKRKPQKLPAITIDQLPEFINRSLATNLHPQTVLALFVQLFTQLRAETLVKLKWSYITEKLNGDFILTVPKEDLKGGQRESWEVDSLHIFITPQLKRVFMQLYWMSGGSEYVFPSKRSKKTYMNSQTVQCAIKDMGYSKKMCSHGFRALFSTTMNERFLHIGKVINKKLSHHSKHDQISDRYNRAQYHPYLKEVDTNYAFLVEQACEFNFIIFNDQRTHIEVNSI